MYAALSYECMRPGLKVLVYEASSYECMRPKGTSVCGLKLRVYEASPLATSVKEKLSAAHIYTHTHIYMSKR